MDVIEIIIVFIFVNMKMRQSTHQSEYNSKVYYKSRRGEEKGEKINKHRVSSWYSTTLVIFFLPKKIR